MARAAIVAAILALAEALGMTRDRRGHRDRGAARVPARARLPASARASCSAAPSPPTSSRQRSSASMRPRSPPSSTSPGSSSPRVLVMFMQAGLRVPGDGLLARQERRHRRGEGADQLRRRSRSRGGWPASRSRSAVAAGSPATPASSCRSATCSGAGSPIAGPARRRGQRVRVLPARLLRGLAGDRLGHDARACALHRLSALRGRVRRR